MSAVRLCLGDDETGVVLRVIGRAHPGGLGVFDDNWLLAHVTARTPTRTLRYDAFLRATDFASFRAELDELVAGRVDRARFWPSAPWVGLRLAPVGAGRYRCQVYARDGGSERSFELDLALDGAGFERLTREVDHVARAFPVLP